MINNNATKINGAKKAQKKEHSCATYCATIIFIDEDLQSWSKPHD